LFEEAEDIVGGVGIYWGWLFGEVVFGGHGESLAQEEEEGISRADRTTKAVNVVVLVSVICGNG
jgi:hypothetical protein